MQKEKKYTSMQSFIKDKELKKEYENRCWESDQRRQQEELEREGIITADLEDDYDLAANLNGQNTETFN
jgi:hypothetical protein